MQIKSYSIKSEYIPNNELKTKDHIPGITYWDNKRSYAATFYQFYAYKYIAGLIKERSLTSIIDVGCGVAAKLALLNKKLPDLKIIGIDQQSAIDFCKNTYDFGEWYVEDFETLSEDPGIIKADVVSCIDVIEHVSDPDLILEYLKTKINNEGFIVIATPERDRARGKKCNESPNKYHVREWNAEEFKQYLISRNLEIIDQKLFYPCKIGLSTLFIKELTKFFIKYRSGMSFRSNQVIVCKRAN